ncbi:histone deacetylase hda1 [Stylonychia lemnae]|uniref:histone deacetylase n=1 Tax=Stylonychia lemnae TaxID=5949 RepID=A0A077ZSK8_STYLE|nr:histone deacetylase hda1 [Stylonychia lemnae]|eukprot:CDW72549.1 histone deacetylase hda1 [Stylonychia lemnae]
MEGLQTQDRKVFYVYDERMLAHKQYIKPPPEGSTQKVLVNPEIPERISSIYNHLKNEGLLDQMDKLEVQGLDEIEELIAAIHSQELIDKVRDSCAKLAEGESSNVINPGQGEIYECKDTYEAAKISAAGAVAGLRDILDGKHEKGYCIIRPPGHHAYHNHPAGFCLFNNVAIATKVALSAPYNLERVLIFDWDIHHGDGTQALFYDDPRVLFMSLHRTDKLTFYPGYKECLPEFVGEGKGQGFNVNVAWETGLVVDEVDRSNNTVSTLGNHDYRYACDTLLFPIIEQFQPQLVIVSCGFDSAIHDFLGFSNVSPLMYQYMTSKLASFCPKLLVVQEGGYNIDYLGQHAQGVTNGLLGNEINKVVTQADKDFGISTIEEVDIQKANDYAIENVELTRKHIKEFWKNIEKE